MQNKYQKIVLILVGAIVILVGIVGIYRNNQKRHRPQLKENVSETVSADTILDLTKATSTLRIGNAIAQIESLPPLVTNAFATSTAPAISRQFTITFDTNQLPLEARNIILKKMNELEGLLRLNHLDTSAWLRLGLYRKMIGDYQGARQAWEYVSLISPNNTVSFASVGDLYHYYLRDYPKAEKNLIQAIKNDPGSALVYRNLFDLYHLSYLQQTNKAEETLLDGISKVNNPVDLMVLIASFYVEKGRTVEAKKYYELALTASQTLKNEQLMNQIQTELIKLK